MTYPKVLAAALLLAVCAAPAMSSTPQKIMVSVRELAEHPDQFNGRHISVRGYVVISSHGRNIFESKKDYDNPHGACLGLLGSKSFVRSMRKREEVVTGIFRKTLCGPHDVCLYWCSTSGIEVDN